MLLFFSYSLTYFQYLREVRNLSYLLSKALGKGVKEKLSLFLYVLAIPLAFVNPWISAAIFIIVALIWIVPDKRIENALKKSFRT